MRSRVAASRRSPGSSLDGDAAVACPLECARTGRLRRHTFPSPIAGASVLGRAPRHRAGMAIIQSIVATRIQRLRWVA